MSNQNFHCDSDDDDIWDYQPRQRNKFSQVQNPRQAISGSNSSKSQKEIQSYKPGRKRSACPSKTQYQEDIVEKKPRIAGRRKDVKQSQPKNLPQRIKLESNNATVGDNCRKTKDEPIKKSKTNTKKHLKSTKVKVELVTADSVKKETESRTGYCPVCQMPYSALSIVQSPTWHIHECLEIPYSSKKECPKGLSCDNTIQSHYKKFHHKQLARYRAKLKSGKSQSVTATETKRKIEFESSCKENIPDNNNKIHVESTITAENLPDELTNRDLDQMLMDALGDNDNGNDIPFEQNPLSQVVQSETSIFESNCLVNRNSNMDTRMKCRQENQVTTGHLDSAIVITDSDVSNNSGTVKIMMTTPSKKGIKHDDISASQENSIDAQPQKDSSVKPSFFELSQSAQKLGFFAKKRRQQNQKSTSISNEEIPPKKARKRISDTNSTTIMDKHSKVTCFRGTNDLSGDANNNFTKISSKADSATINSDILPKVDDDPGATINTKFGSKMETVSQYPGTQQKFDVDARETVTVNDEKLSGTDIKDKSAKTGTPENELNIRIEYVRSRASDIYYGIHNFTEIIVKSSVNAQKDNEPVNDDNEAVNDDNETVNDDNEAVNDGIGSDSDDNEPEISQVDNVSSASESSRADILCSDSEQCDSEMVTDNDPLERMNENPDLMLPSLRLGGGGFIIYSQTCDTQEQGALEADTTLTNVVVKEEEEMFQNQENYEKPLVKSDEKDKPVSDDSATPKAEKLSYSKASPIVNAFNILMQKGKSLSQKLLNRNSSRETGKNAMDILMSNSGKQNVKRDIKPKKEWSGRVKSEADDTHSESGREEGFKRNCPFYKKIPDTPFTVDAFRYGNIPDCKAYFLTHFHYDHYGGLTKSFSNPIYCSQITCNLVKQKIKTDSRYLHPLPLNSPTVIEGTEVTFLDANHCPGSVLILFRLRNGKVYLHTGDFRASPKMEVYPSLVDLHVHSLYLDTTYCDPQYTFPPQEDVISYAVQLALDARTANPKTLIVCGSYTIGKERIFTAIAEALNCKISVMRDKKSILDCLDDQSLSAKVSLRWEDSGLHVLPMGKLNYKGLDDHLKAQGDRFDSVLALEPTGWACTKRFKSLAELKPKMKKDRITLYSVPYSEHSSYLEMKRFVQFIRPDKILPTVNNGNVHSRKKMEVIFETWNNELKQGTK